MLGLHPQPGLRGLYFPLAELKYLVGLQVTQTDADDQGHRVRYRRFAQRAEVEGVGDTLAIEGVETVRVGRAGEQLPHLGVYNLKDITSRTVARAEPFLVGQGIEDNNF